MTQVVVNPHDGSIVCEHPYMDERRDELLEGLVAAQRAWREVPLPERVERIGAVLAGFSEHAEAIARDLSLQVGKPIRQSRGEVQGCVARAEHVLSLAPAALATDVLEDLPGRGEGVIERRIRHEPLGVIANLAAWNYPLLIPVNVVIPALAAGNAVLLKHSERTPLCGEWFERIFAPLEGVLRQVVLTHEQTAAWLTDARIDGVGFTGSVRGGLAVQRAARERFVPVGLELGGKDPAYVAEDADLEFSAPNVVEGACYNAGQSCCAIERVYVHRSRYEEFLERAEAALADWTHGDPLDEATTLGPQATERAPELLETHVRDAIESGAKLVAGGERGRETGWYFQATLLRDVPQGCLAMQEESFGPLVCVHPVDDDAEALAKMNDSRFGLTASVWTESAARADWFADRLEAGTVFQNRCDVLDPGLPWTGWKESGRGVTLSRYGYANFTRLKGLHLRR